MKMSSIQSTSLMNIISFLLLIVGGKAGVLLDSGDDNDFTSVGEIEITDSNFDRSQIGNVEQFAKSKRIIHETPESRLVLDDITDNYANNDLITQQSQTTNTKVTDEGKTSTHKVSAQQELMQKTNNQQTNKLDKQTARHHLKMHDQTTDENLKINGVYADLTENVNEKLNGESETTIEGRQGDYSSEASSKTNIFLMDYIPKTLTGNELFAEMRTTTYGKGTYSNNESLSKTTLKVTPGNDEIVTERE